MRNAKPRDRGGDGTVGGGAGSGRGRKKGSKDGLWVVRAPRNEEAKALNVMQNQGKGTQPKLYFGAAPGGPFARVENGRKRQRDEMDGAASKQKLESKQCKRLSLNRDKEGLPTLWKQPKVSHVGVYGSVVHTIGS